MLVDEVEPKKTARLTLCWIAQCCQDMPRSSNRQEHQRTGNEVQFPQDSKTSGQDQEKADRTHRKYKSNQPFCQDVQCADCCESPAEKATGSVVIDRPKKEV